MGRRTSRTRPTQRAAFRKQLVFFIRIGFPSFPQIYEAIEKLERLLDEARGTEAFGATTARERYDPPATDGPRAP